MIPAVGWWYSQCCEQGLYQIESDDELAELLAEDAEFNEEYRSTTGLYSYWPTREAALAELQSFVVTHGPYPA